MYDPSEALLQLGLYDYVWGNPSLLQTYNANVQAQKARDEQAQYNMLWKQIEDEKANREKLKEEALAQKEKEAKLAELYKAYNNADGAQEKAYIKRQIRALEGSKAVESEMLKAFDADKAAKEQAVREESERHSAALKEMARINDMLRKIKKPEQKDQLANLVYDKEKFPAMSPEERDKMFAEIKGIKTFAEKTKDAVEGAVTSYTGKKVGEKLDEKDKAAKYQEMKTQGKILTPSQEALRKKYYGE